jgi:hypothetical protein
MKKIIFIVLVLFVGCFGEEDPSATEQYIQSHIPTLLEHAMYDFQSIEVTIDGYDFIITTDKPIYLLYSSVQVYDALSSSSRIEMAATFTLDSPNVIRVQIIDPLVSGHTYIVNGSISAMDKCRSRTPYPYPFFVY